MIEVKNHNSNLLSIKNLGGDIHVDDGTWDNIFNSIIKNTSSFFFIGNRLERENAEVKSRIEIISEKIISIQDDYHLVVIKIKPGNIIISRNSLAKLWECYEYPAIVFMKDDLLEQKKAIGLFVNKRTYDEIFSIIKGAYIVYKSFELDVLWVKKSDDMNFSLWTNEDQL